MNQFDEICLNYFLEHQTQLFREEVASTLEEAEEFLEDCLAVICVAEDDKTLCGLMGDYLEENGADISGMSLKDIEEACEVFPLPDGRYLVVEV